MLRAQGILHWNGAYKPWKVDGLYADVWTPYWKEMQTEQDEYKCTGALACIDGPFDSVRHGFEF